jgi:hypothetical protein
LPRFFLPWEDKEESSFSEEKEAKRLLFSAAAAAECFPRWSGAVCGGHNRH